MAIGWKSLFKGPYFYIVFTAALISVALLFPLTNSLKESRSAQELEVARRASLTVKNFLFSKITALQITSRNIDIENLGSPENVSIIKSVLDDKDFFEISLVDKSGGEIFKFSQFEIFTVEDLKNISRNEEFAALSHEPGPYVSDVELSARLEPFVTIALTLPALPGEFSGLLSAKLSVRSIYSSVESISLGEDSQVYITDRKGILIGHKDSSLIPKRLDYTGRRIVSDTLFEKRPLVSSDDTYSYKNEDGVRVLAAGDHIHETGWAVVFEESRSQALRDLRIVQVIILFIIGVVLLLFLILARINFQLVRTKSDLEKAFLKAKTSAEASEKSRLEELAAKKQLEVSIADLNDVKAAFLNILEDSRISEERERRQAEELKKALEQVGQFASVADQERNTYLLLLSSIGEGVFVMDLDRKVVIINRAAERILGYEANEIIGQRFDTLLKFIHKDKSPLESSFWDEAFSEKVPKILPPDILVIGKSGLPVPIADVTAPIIDSRTKELKGLIVTFRDVREERALEEARIGFISTSSHQLRTPLTSMRWFSEMLLSGDAGALNDEQRHFIERIYQGTDRMIALVNLLLQIARVEAGRVRIEPVPIDLKNTTEGVLLTLKANFESKSQKVEIKTIPPSLPLIPMDQEVVWQVVQNLLSNASRYSPEKSTIYVNIIQKGKEIEYSVKDNGIGIPKEYQDRIFEKFFRAENALAYVPEGSGLGLSLVKILVEGWGGKIWFESEVNKGTTFHFTISVEGMKAKAGEVKLNV